MIPQNFIDDLLYRLDIADVVGRYVQLKSAGANLQGLCPFHKEKSPSFSVSPSKQFYHCFGCGASGNAIGFVMEHLGMTFPEAVEQLAGQLGMDVPYEKGMDLPEEVRSERDQIVELLTRAANYYKAQLKQSQRAVQYLKNRGLTGQIAARYGLGYAPDDYQNLESVVEDYAGNALLDTAGLTKQSEQNNRRYDRFRDRVMFPIRNPKGQVIGFGGRVIEKAEPKYLNSPETPVFHKGHEVYGLFEARQAIHKKGYVLITEGYMDVVALAQWGFENAVATLGTAVTPDHVQKLFKQTDRLVFAFDGDGAGQKAAWRALQACLSHVNESKRADFIFLPTEHDPDSYVRTEGPEGFEALVSKALSLSDYLLKQINAQFQVQQVEGSSAAVAFLKPLVSQVQPSVFRSALVRSLSELLSMTPVELSSHLGLKRPVGEGQVFRRKGKDSSPPVSFSPRPRAKSALVGLAARLVRAPQCVQDCFSLVELYEKSDALPQEGHSFIHLVEKIKDNPTLLMARLPNAFNDQVHQSWVNGVVQEAQQLDDEIDFETELKDAVYQCSEAWFKSELERLSKLMPLQGEQLALYHEFMRHFQNFKQKRVNQL